MLSFIITLLICVPLMIRSITMYDSKSNTAIINILIVVICVITIIIDLGVYIYGKRKI